MSLADFLFAGAELLPPAWSGTSCFQTCKLSPRVILLATASPFLRHFPPPAPAGSVFSCGLICRLTLANLGANRPFVRPPFLCLPAAPRLLALSVSAYLLVKSFHYVIPAVPVLIGWFGHFFADRRHIVLSSRFRISCTVVGSFFFLVGFPVRSIAR